MPTRRRILADSPAGAASARVRITPRVSSAPTTVSAGHGPAAIDLRSPAPDWQIDDDRDGANGTYRNGLTCSSLHALLDLRFSRNATRCAASATALRVALRLRAQAATLPTPICARFRGKPFASDGRNTGDAPADVRSIRPDARRETQRSDSRESQDSSQVSDLHRPLRLRQHVHHPQHLGRRSTSTSARTATRSSPASRSSSTPPAAWNASARSSAEPTASRRRAALPPPRARRSKLLHRRQSDTAAPKSPRQPFGERCRSFLHRPSPSNGQPGWQHGWGSPPRFPPPKLSDGIWLSVEWQLSAGRCMM